jgi:hypothetical protein
MAYITHTPMPRQVNQCPVCDAPLRITELSCVRCDTKLHGHFPPAPLARLSSEHQMFIETFVRCRGVIRDMERALGVSYPTVRARLDAVVQALEEALEEDRRRAAEPPSTAERDARRRELLRQVEDGTLDPADAAEALRSL